MTSVRSFIGVVGQMVVVGGMLMVSAGTSRADVDCSTIAACALSPPNSGVYHPAFQVNMTGPFQVEMDVFTDASCGTFFDTASADGTDSFGLTTFEYFYSMSPGDTMSMKVRVRGCPPTDCLTVVAGRDVCQGF